MSNFTYPDDDPAAILDLRSQVASGSDEVTTEAGTVRSFKGRFAFGWDGVAADAAGAETDVVADYLDDAATGIAEAETPLQRYADVLVDVRAAIDVLRTAYDDEINDYTQRVAAVRIEHADDPVLARTVLDDLAESHRYELGELRRRYDDEITTTDGAATTVSTALIESAGRVSPDPASNNPELVRADALEILPFMASPDAPSVIVTDGGVVVTGTGGDDLVTVETDPETGDVLVVINGATYRLDDDQAAGLLIRTGDGSDVVDVDPEVTEGLIVSGGGGDDLIAGGAGSDTVLGGGGDDLLIGGSGSDTIAGDHGKDEIVDTTPAGFADAFDMLERFGWVVSVRGGGGQDTVSGGSGDDVIHTESGRDVVRGGSGDDVILGGSGDDDIDGGRGDDHLDGGTGDDVLRGGDGNDTVYGLDGDDRIAGGGGRDYLDGGEGDDDIDGGRGNDQVVGGNGDDELTGGTGADVIVTGAGDDRVVDRGDSGTDIDSDGVDETDTVYAEDGDDGDIDADDTDAPRVDVDPELGSSVVVDPGASPEFRARVESDLAMLRATPEGRELLASLDESGHTVTIHENDDGLDSAESDGGLLRSGDGTVGVGVDSDVYYTPNRIPGGPVDDVPAPVVLFHELTHADDHVHGTGEPDVDVDEGDLSGEPTDEREPGGELATTGLPYDQFRDEDGDGVDDEVGIEPNEEPFSENSFREMFGIPLRDDYDSS